MPLTAQSPVPALFGYEVSSPENKNKSLLRQCSDAMRANGIAVADPIPAVGETPIDVEKRWLKDLIAAAVPTKATKNFLDAGAVPLLKVTAKLAGYAGNSITVTIEAGTMSGKKVTVTDGVTPEVYDDQADVAAIVASLAASLLVDAELILEGTLANIAATPLAGGGGAAVTAPSFSGVALDDGQSQQVSAWGRALFDALRTAGYIA